ncbi:MAG: hypothetical protein ACRDTA_29495, partial [Pseudonocardiaceae bacterium]
GTGDGGLGLDERQDLARRGATLLGRPEFAALAAAAGRPARELASDAIAWRHGGCGGLAVLHDTWQPDAEALAEGLAALGQLGATRVWRNRIACGPLQLRLTPDAQWYRLTRSSTTWDLDAPPDTASSTRPRTQGRLVIAVTTLALVLSGAGVATWATLTHRAGPPATPSPLPTPLSTQPSTQQPPAEVPTDEATDPPSAVNSDGTALDRLTRQISLDRPQVQGELAAAWVPQLSSKNLGITVNSVSYGYPEILDDHLALRSTYSAWLVWSGDWSTFGRGDFYVTVAPVSFSTPAEANAWCDRQAIDSDNCFAKRLSTVAGSVGSTVTR